MELLDAFAGLTKRRLTEFSAQAEQRLSQSGSGKDELERANWSAEAGSASWLRFQLEEIEKAGLSKPRKNTALDEELKGSGKRGELSLS